MFNRPIRLFLLTTLILTLLTGFAITAQGQTPKSIGGADLEAALKWMQTLQNPDGGYSDGSKPDSSLTATADAVFAIAVVGEDVTTFKKGDKTPIDYLEAQVTAGNVTTLSQYAKVLRAATAAGVLTTGGDVPGEAGGIRKFGGIDLAQQTLDLLSKSLDGKDYYSESLAVLGLAEIGVEIPPETINNLIKAQNKDGGWGTAAGQPSDVITTSTAIQALITVGKLRLVGAALDYFRKTQNGDGGWPSQNPGANGTDSDCISTAAAFEALQASGEDMPDWHNPNEFLAKFQQKDGSFSIQLKSPAPNFLATVAVTAALSSDFKIDVPGATPGK